MPLLQNIKLTPDIHNTASLVTVNDGLLNIIHQEGKINASTNIIEGEQNSKIYLLIYYLK